MSAGRRKVPKQERSKATVEALLEAAARVLVRRGYEGATTVHIAEESGYGVGSLYDYFPNKEALVVALIERHAEEMLALVEASFSAHADSPPYVAVRAWVEGGVRANLAAPELHKVLVEQVPRVGDPSRIGEIEGRVVYLVRSYLERHAGEIGPGDLCEHLPEIKPRSSAGRPGPSRSLPLSSILCVVPSGYGIRFSKEMLFGSDSRVHTNPSYSLEAWLESIVPSSANKASLQGTHT